jgi:peptidoglycan/LPS O-acetylase OafA/YrhL
MEYACPHCRSENTQSARMALSEGTYQGESRGWFFGVGLSRIELRDGLARRFVQDPEPQANMIAIVVGMILAAIGLLALFLRGPDSNASPLFGAIMVILGAVFIVGALKENSSLGDRQARWRAALEDMRETWICRRCGHTWSP